MADQNPSPVGCLGRALTFLGVVWIGIVVLATIGVLTERQVGGDFLVGISGSIVPAILLLAAGRALRRRAKTAEDLPGPVIAPPRGTAHGSRVPTMRPQPTAPTGPSTILTPPRLPSSGPISTKPQVKPAPKPVSPAKPVVTRSLEDVVPPPDKDLPDGTEPLPPIDLKPAPLKTSQELVDEARKRWGGDRPRYG